MVVTNAITLLVSTQISLRTPNGKVIMGREAYDQISKFQKLFLVRNKLYEYYDGKISDDVLVEGAIKGMTNSLNDPYTVYMNEKSLQILILKLKERIQDLDYKWELKKTI